MMLTGGEGGKDVIGKAFVGSISFDGTAMEASVHWLDNSVTDVDRQYDVFSFRVATGHPFAVDLAEFQDCYRKFANFIDWLLAVRVERLKKIWAMPERESPEIALPEPEHQESDSEDDEAEEHDDSELELLEERTSTSNTQAM